jgi:ankyrin repeat protein
VTSTSFQGYSPLHLAADRNRPEFVKFLLEAGADKNLPDLEGMTALEMAELNGSDWAEVAALL